MTAPAQTPAPQAPTHQDESLVDHVKRLLNVMSAAEQLRHVGDLMSFASQEFSAAAERAFAVRFPRIKTITWEIEHSHDDQGGMYSYIDTLTYTRDDGTCVAFGNIDEDLEHFVRDASTPGDVEEADADLRLMRSILESDSDEDIGWEDLHHAFAGFSGCDPNDAKDALEAVWYSAEASRDYSGWDGYNLR